MPIALAAPEVIGVVLVALILVVMLVALQLYSSGRQARAFAVNLPVVADPVTAALDFVLALVVSGARVVDLQFSNWLYGGVAAFGRFVVLAFNAAGAALLSLIHDTAARAVRAEALATHVEVVELPALYAELQATRAALDALALRIVPALQAQVATDERTIGQQAARILALEQVVARDLAPYVPMLARLASLPVDAAEEIGRLAALVAGLTAAESILGAQAGILSGGVSALERQVGQQQAALERLAALGVLAVAGSAVLAELVRIGRDPCGVCSGLNLSDLEGRVALLEVSGF